MLQGVLHHCCLSPMAHLKDASTRRKSALWNPGLDSTNSKSIQLRFWEGQSFVDVETAKLPGEISVVDSKMTPTGHLQSIISLSSLKPPLVDDVVWTFLKALHQDISRQKGIQYAFFRNVSTSENLSLWAQLQQFGWFWFVLVVLLQTLSSRLFGSLDEKWMHATTYLRELGHWSFQTLVMTFWLR